MLQQILNMKEEVLYDIFLDIHKSYDALDRNRCLDILVAYRVVPCALRLLWRYWDRLTMVAPTGGYFVTPLKGYHGVTQGPPLSPTIFNVVVDVFL